jgi:hypothetical protein
MRSLGLAANYAGAQQLAEIQARDLKLWERPIKVSGYTAE